MRSQFETSEYVKGLSLAGLVRAHAQTAVAQATAVPRPGDAATVADLEKLKERIDAAAMRAEAEFKRFRKLTFVGILLLCASMLLLHFSRS